MKTKILNYFKNDRTYRGGVTLIHQFSPKLGLKKQLNIHPQSDYLKEVVFEELRELADLKIAEFNAILAIPLPKAEKPAASPEPIPLKAAKIPAKEEKPKATPVSPGPIPLKAAKTPAKEKKPKATPVAVKKGKAQPVKKVSRKK